jgi:hypothetical protein
MLERIELIAEVLSDALGTGGSVTLFKDEYDALSEEDKALSGPTYDEAEGYIDPSLFPTALSFINALNEIVDANGEELEALREALGEDFEEAMDYYLSFPPA